MKKKLEIYRKKDKGQNTVPDLDELDEEYIRRVEEMERELFADEDFEDYEPTDEQERESYARLIQRLKDDGIYCEDDNAEKKRAAGMEKPRKTAGGRRKIYFAKVGKVAGVAILCCACVFAASMTSEANRTYLVNNIRVWSGMDTKTVIFNDSENENADPREDESVANIENELDIDMPVFYYRPYGLEFVSYEIDKYVAMARIEYQYEKNIITFLISKEDNNTSSNVNIMRGREREKIIVGDDDIEVLIKEVEDPQDERQTYVAEWGKENVMYQLIGKIELSEMEQMMKQMKF